MAEAVAGARPVPSIGGDKVLKASAVTWFVVAVIGQWIFAAYVALFYGGTALRGEYARWDESLHPGIVAGDVAGNLAVAAHVLLAFVITVAGPLQLIPQIRNRFRAFHRWNGRIYLATAFLISMAGLYMVWLRSDSLVLGPKVSISINALLIFACAAMALRQAMARNIDSHRRWVLRLFMVVSGVWFLRVGIVLWILLNKGEAVGIGESFDGPVAITLSYAQFLVPLGVLQVYLMVKDRAGPAGRLAMGAGLFLLTGAMAVGIAGASGFLWLPKM